MTNKDYFPLPFNDNILDVVVGHECCSFFDGFSSYTQISIIVLNQSKIIFMID